MSSHSPFWLLIPAWIFYSLDVIFTLSGQPAEYWSGDYSKAIETNPIALPLLNYHPGLFTGLAFAWGIILGILCWRFHGTWLTRLLIIVAFAHAMGSCSWIIRTTGWIGGVVYLVVASQLVGWFWKKSRY